MIHILKWILKILASVIFGGTLGFGGIILSILFWDSYYLDRVGECLDHLWEQ